MARLTRLTMLVIFVVHLMVGCCAHHAHACQHDGAPASSEAASHHQADHAHHGLHDCQGGRCSFVLPANHVVEKSSPQTLDMPVLLQSEYRLSSNASPAFACGDHAPPPIRLHLAIQVLLI